jgi:hypothetical protein
VRPAAAGMFAAGLLGADLAVGLRGAGQVAGAPVAGPEAGRRVTGPEAGPPVTGPEAVGLRVAGLVAARWGAVPLAGPARVDLTAVRPGDGRAARNEAVQRRSCRVRLRVVLVRGRSAAVPG